MALITLQRVFDCEIWLSVWLVEHLWLVSVWHWGQLECSLEIIAGIFLWISSSVIIRQTWDHSGNFLATVEIVSGFQHNVLYSWLNLGVENRFTIRSYKLVGWTIMVLMGTTIVEIRLNCLLLLRLLNCQICLRVIRDGNLMRKVLIWVDSIPSPLLNTTSLLLKLDNWTKLLSELALGFLVSRWYFNLSRVNYLIWVPHVHLLGHKRDVVLVPANEVRWEWLG